MYVNLELKQLGERPACLKRKAMSYSVTAVMTMYVFREKLFMNSYIYRHAYS